MIKTNTFTPNESIALDKQIALVSPTDTPFFTMLLKNGSVEDVKSPVVFWREKALDTTADISQVEGSETTNFYQSSRTELSNYMEIFKKATAISGTAQASDITGISDLMAEEIVDRLTEVKINVEKQLINGVKNDGANTPYIRRMGGLLSFVKAENIVSGTFDEAALKDTVKKLWENGVPTNRFVAMLNADLKESVDGLFDGKYSYVAQENTFGLVVSNWQSNYGTVSFVLNRHMPTDKIVVFAPEFVKLSYLRRPVFEPLAKTGDNVKGQIITEVTLKVMSQNAVAMFDAI